MLHYLVNIIRNRFVSSAFNGAFIGLCLLAVTGCGAAVEPGTGGNGFADIGGNGTATLSWNAPTTRADGSSLLDWELAGFRVLYGTEPDNYTEVVDIADPAQSGYVVEGLLPGTYYFVTTAYDIDGLESGFSNMASKVIS